MTNRNDIEKRIEDALNSLDGIRRAAPQPFFYTRLRTKLEQAKAGVWENISSFISRPVMMLATVCIVVLLNAAVLYRSHISSVKVPAADQLDQISADAYDVASNSNSTLYNIWGPDNDQHIQQ